MTKHTKAQLHALDRVMYLLEEHSFQTLGMDDDAFAKFIEELYSRVNLQTRLLAETRN